MHKKYDECTHWIVSFFLRKPKHLKDPYARPYLRPGIDLFGCSEPENTLLDVIEIYIKKAFLSMFERSAPTEYIFCSKTSDQSEYSEDAAAVFVGCLRGGLVAVDVQHVIIIPNITILSTSFPIPPDPSQIRRFSRHPPR